jgi:hypothetical protein
MTFYFVGGEDHDFTKVGACTVDTATTAARRTANARCALKVGTSATITDGWVGSLSQPVSSLWMTARFYPTGSNVSANSEFFSLTDGTVRRLLLRINGSTNKYELCKRTSASSTTLLATSSVALTFSVAQKLDVNVTYGTSGSVNVYLDGTLVISYSGDVTTDSATTLSGFVLGVHTAVSACYWSEIIAASEDTRALNLVTLAPTANGNTYTFDTGNYANVNETVTDDTGLITSGTAGELAQFTVNASGITGTPAIRALCVSARAQKGGSGPQNAKMSVRSGGIDQLGSAVPLPAAMNRAAYIFPTNPGTGGSWAYSDLTAAGFNIGIRSEN